MFTRPCPCSRVNYIPFSTLVCSAVPGATPALGAAGPGSSLDPLGAPVAEGGWRCTVVAGGPPGTHTDTCMDTTISSCEPGARQGQ